MAYTEIPLANIGELTKLTTGFTTIPLANTGELTKLTTGFTTIPLANTGELTKLTTGFGTFQPLIYEGRLSFVLVGSGGVFLGGQADIVGDPIIPTGGVDIGGGAAVSAISVLIFELYPIGGTTVGGAGPNSFNWSTFVPTSGVRLGGTASVSSVAIQHYTIPDPEGGVVLGGVADVPYPPSGGVVIGGAAEEFFTFSFVVVPDGGVSIGGTAALIAAFRHVSEGGVLLGGNAPNIGYFPEHVPTGGMHVGGTARAFMLPSGAVSTPENPYADAFAGWAINRDTGAPSRYVGFAANSMCQLDGVTYVANAGGIYAVRGKTDAGQPIFSQITLPKSDFGEARDKRVPVIYFGTRSEGDLILKVVAKQAAGRYYAVTARDDAVRGSRATLGKGLESRYWQFRLENKAGAYFEIDSMDFAPILLKRQGV